MDTEHLLRELLAVIHGDGGHHAQRHGLEESCRQAHLSLTRLRDELQELLRLAYIGEHYFPDLSWKTRCEELLDKLHGLEESARQAHERIADLRRALDTAEERGAKWAIDERGLHAKCDTRPMARELCERMRGAR